MKSGSDWHLTGPVQVDGMNENDFTSLPFIPSSASQQWTEAKRRKKRVEF